MDRDPWLTRNIYIQRAINDESSIIINFLTNNNTNIVSKFKIFNFILYATEQKTF